MVILRLPCLSCIFLGPTPVCLNQAVRGFHLTMFPPSLPSSLLGWKVFLLCMGYSDVRLQSSLYPHASSTASLLLLYRFSLIALSICCLVVKPRSSHLFSISCGISLSHLSSMWFFLGFWFFLLQGLLSIFLSPFSIRLSPLLCFVVLCGSSWCGSLAFCLVPPVSPP